jgi:hypothetical protein
MVAHEVCFCTFSELHKKWFMLVELCTNIIPKLQKQYTEYIFYISMYTYSNARPADLDFICGCLLQFSWRQSFLNAGKYKLIKLLGINNKPYFPSASYHHNMNCWTLGIPPPKWIPSTQSKYNEIFWGRQLCQKLTVYHHFGN